jgi:hypothetical protein
MRGCPLPSLPSTHLQHKTSHKYENEASNRRSSTNLDIAVTALPAVLPAKLIPPEESPTHNAPSPQPAASRADAWSHIRDVTTGGVRGADADDVCGGQMGKDWHRDDKLRESQV